MGKGDTLGFCVALGHSLYEYPSCIFWYITLSTIISYLVIFSKNYIFQKQKSIVTTLVMIHLSKSLYCTIFLIITSLIFLSIITYYLTNYYRRTHRDSDSITKIKLNICLVCYGSISVLYVLFLLLSSILPQNSYLLLISYIGFYVTHPFLHIIPKTIVKLRHFAKKFRGTIVLCILVVNLFIEVPLIIYCFYKSITEGILIQITSILFIVSFFMHAISFLYDATAVLGHRFVKLYLYMPSAINRMPISRHSSFTA